MSASVCSATASGEYAGTRTTAATDTVRGLHVDVVEAGTAQRDDPHAERRQPGHG
jgi:hypothetical protein